MTTSLALVVFTTVFYGSTVGMLSSCLFKNEEHEPCLETHKPKRGPSEPLIKGDINGSFESVDLSQSDSSYHAMLHPNQERKHHKKMYTGCSKYLHRFDELIMKPIFIYKYEKNMQRKSKEFFNLFMKEGNEIEKEFTREGMTE